jgi:serine/threonine-protein kinase
MSHCTRCGTEVPTGAQFCANCGSRVGSDQETARTEKIRRPSQESVAESERRLLNQLRQATLGDYEILDEVGRGGMAFVFLAHDISLDRKVAIKVMSPALTLMDPGIQERFNREARTAASLSHPHIIPVYAVRDSEEIAYFVMKYVEGRGLETVIKEVGALPVPVVQTILNQAGSALGYAHRNGVVHRDVKPGNILLDQEGWVVVTDFGIAKVAEAKALTMTGGMVGTPSYMSPEQCGGREVTGAVDQYALGVVAYEMITGQLPFHSETVVNLLYDHCHTPPTPLQELAPDCPPEIAAAVMRMLEKDPANRWPSVEAAVEAIGTVTDSKSGVVRTHMLTLAKGKKRTTAESLLEKFSTPPSAMRSTPPTPVTPTPLSVPQPPTEATAGGGRRGARRALWAAPALAAAVVGLWFVFGRTPADGTSAPTPVEGQAEEPARSALRVAAIDVSPPTVTLPAGERAALRATPRDTGGTEVLEAAVEWSSSDPAVATVSTDGAVTAVAPGNAAITARSGASSATIAVQVSPPPARPAAPTRPTAVASVGISPASAATVAGESIQLQAVLRDRSGAVLTGRDVRWSSSNPALAQVSDAGLVTGIAEGTVQITATSGGRSGSATVSVSAQPVASLEVSPRRGTILVGATLRLSATPRDDAGTALGGRQVAWTSGNAAVARVSSGGIVTGVAPGSATITATSGSTAARVAVTVEAPAAADDPALANPRPEIEQLLETYRRAIESRDLDRLRAAYPGMTADQEQAWRGFFGNVSALQATLEILELDVSGDTARARVEATYEYRMNRAESQTFVFTASFRRGANGWRMDQVQ